MRIALIGFMGAGKSWLGKQLAQQFQIEFMDLDKYIEQQEVASIPEIFEKFGEDHFRKLESKYLKQLTNKDNFIVALGGGTPCFENNMDMINNFFTSVYLEVAPKILADRLQKSKNPRPLIANKSGDELQQFVIEKLHERLPFYQKANLTINANTAKNKEFISEVFRSVSDFI